MSLKSNLAIENAKERENALDRRDQAINRLNRALMNQSRDQVLYILTQWMTVRELERLAARYAHQQHQ